jgi:hypothetical protein
MDGRAEPAERLPVGPLSASRAHEVRIAPEVGARPGGHGVEPRIGILFSDN